MDEILKTTIAYIDDEHDRDRALAGHVVVVSLISERLDRAVHYRDQAKILEYELMLQHYARGMRRLVRAIHRGDDPKWPPEGSDISRSGEGESPDR